MSFMGEGRTDNFDLHAAERQQLARMRTIELEQIARAQAVNQLHDAIRHLSATEIAAIVSTIRSGTGSAA